LFTITHILVVMLSKVPLADMAWEKMDAAGGPSPRSGHRMVLFRKKLVVFGGFQDNNRSTPKYFNDVCVASSFPLLCAHMLMTAMRMIQTVILFSYSACV
jgi:hypothetical protein